VLKISKKSQVKNLCLKTFKTFHFLKKKSCPTSGSYLFRNRFSTFFEIRPKSIKFENGNVEKINLQKNQWEGMQPHKMSKSFDFLRKKSCPTSWSCYLEFVFQLFWNFSKMDQNWNLEVEILKIFKKSQVKKHVSQNLQNFSFFEKKKLPNFRKLFVWKPIFNFFFNFFELFPKSTKLEIQEMQVLTIPPKPQETNGSEWNLPNFSFFEKKKLPNFKKFVASIQIFEFFWNLAKMDQNWNLRSSSAKNIQKIPSQKTCVLKPSKLFIFWKKKVAQLQEVICLETDFQIFLKFGQNRSNLKMETWKR